jgi:hypothetical protein
MKAVPESPLLG